MAQSSTLRIAWRNLGRNRKRSLLAFGAIAFGQFAFGQARSARGQGRAFVFAFFNVFKDVLESRLVDHGAARRVDEDSGWFHPAQ